MKFEKKIVLDLADTIFANKTLGIIPKNAEECFKGTFVRTVAFDNKMQMDIMICGVDFEEGEKNLPWTQAVLYNEKGAELTFTEAEDDFIQTWEIEYEGDVYAAKVMTVSEMFRPRFEKENKADAMVMEISIDDFSVLAGPNDNCPLPIYYKNGELAAKTGNKTETLDKTKLLNIVNSFVGDVFMDAQIHEKSILFEGKKSFQFYKIVFSDRNDAISEYIFKAAREPEFVEAVEYFRSDDEMADFTNPDEEPQFIEKISEEEAFKRFGMHEIDGRGYLI